MIGLKRGTVKLMPHNKGWFSIFEKEKKLLKKKLGNLAIDIQHIGSTSISRIPAKPIIDIAVGVRSLKDVKKFPKLLKSSGYKLIEEAGTSYRIFFSKGAEMKRTHHLHVMKYNGRVWKKDILFRDYLRNHKVRAKQYTNLKKSLAKRFSKERLAYTANKSGFINETIGLTEKK